MKSFILASIVLGSFLVSFAASAEETASHRNTVEWSNLSGAENIRPVSSVPGTDTTRRNGAASASRLKRFAPANSTGLTALSK